MHAVLSIGDFSKITHLSVKTLRHYHEQGLLEPTEIDPHSGYRYYSTGQVPIAQVIRKFRELGMPVREVREMISTSDPVARSAGDFSTPGASGNTAEPDQGGRHLLAPSAVAAGRGD